jgi:hypothetical protein
MGGADAAADCTRARTEVAGTRADNLLRPEIDNSGVLRFYRGFPPAVSPPAEEEVDLGALADATLFGGAEGEGAEGEGRARRGSSVGHALPPSMLPLRHQTHSHYTVAVSESAADGAPAAVPVERLGLSGCCFALVVAAEEVRDGDCRNAHAALPAAATSAPAPALQLRVCAASRSPLSALCAGLRDCQAHALHCQLDRARLRADIDAHAERKAAAVARASGLRAAGEREAMRARECGRQAASDRAVEAFLREQLQVLRAAWDAPAASADSDGAPAPASAALPSSRAALEAEAARLRARLAAHEAARERLAPGGSEDAATAELRLHKKVLSRELRLLQAQREVERRRAEALRGLAERHGVPG